jgi:sortase A
MQMKIRTWLSTILVLAGVVILAIGVWQITNTNKKTNETLSKAKNMLAQKKAIPQQKNNQQDQQDKQGENKPSQIGDTMGILEIPRIKAELAIVEGTDPDDLEKGVGHYKGSSLPSQNGQIVLSGHRDTVFRHLGELKIGDKLIVKVSNGSFSYKITHTKIVDSKDTSIITLQKDHEELILTTCYPFRYIGNAPKRYIIYASPVK